MVLSFFLFLTREWRHAGRPGGDDAQRGLELLTRVPVAQPSAIRIRGPSPIIPSSLIN
jgi:hypothetical protein